MGLRPRKMRLVHVSYRFPDDLVLSLISAAKARTDRGGCAPFAGFSGNFKVACSERTPWDGRQQRRGLGINSPGDHIIPSFLPGDNGKNSARFSFKS
jgi:hypothetical protein